MEKTGAFSVFPATQEFPCWRFKCIFQYSCSCRKSNLSLYPQVNISPDLIKIARALVQDANIVREVLFMFHYKKLGIWPFPALNKEKCIAAVRLKLYSTCKLDASQFLQKTSDIMQQWWPSQWNLGLKLFTYPFFDSACPHEVTNELELISADFGL